MYLLFVFYFKNALTVTTESINDVLTTVRIQGVVKIAVDINSNLIKIVTMT